MRFTYDFLMLLLYGDVFINKIRRQRFRGESPLRARFSTALKELSSVHVGDLISVIFTMQQLVPVSINLHARGGHNE
jgi:hypothetical protein